MTTHLFVGGTNDGTHHEVEPDVQHFRLRIEPPEPEPYNLLSPIVFSGPPMSIEVYRREKFAIGNRIVAQIFVHEHVSTDGMFAALLAGYRQGVPADPGEAYEEGHKRGYRHGMRTAIAAVERLKSTFGPPTMGT